MNQRDTDHRVCAKKLTPAICMFVSFCGLASSIGCKQEAEATDAQKPETFVSVKQLELVEKYVERRSYTGELEARRTSHLSFRQGGILQQVRFDEGDRVNIGSELAALDAKPLQAHREALSAQREEAQAKLDELVAGPRREVVGAATALVQQLDADWKRTLKKEKRSRTLLKRSATSTEEFEATTYDVDVAREKLNAAQFRLQELKSGTRKELLQAQRAVVAKIDAELRKVDLDIHDSTLVAPFDGVVTKRWTNEGEVVNVGQPVFTFVEIGQIEVRVRVPTSVATELVVGKRYPIRIDANEHDVTLQAMIPQVDSATRTIEVAFKVVDSSPDFYPGRIVELLLERDVPAQGFWLQNSALVADVRGMWACYTLQHEPSSLDSTYVVRRQLVEILHAASDRVLVKGTLEPNALVIVEGVHRVVPGQVVRPNPAP